MYLQEDMIFYLIIPVRKFEQFLTNFDRFPYKIILKDNIRFFFGLILSHNDIRYFTRKYDLNGEDPANIPA